MEIRIKSDRMYDLVGMHYCSDGYFSSASEIMPSSDDEKRHQQTIADHFHSLNELEKETSIEVL